VADPRHQLGRRAEEAVAAWLAARGWRVLERRWGSPAGELDLVCRDPAGALVGVEVKLRSTGRAGTGVETLDRRRLGRLRAALATYARTASRPAAGTRLRPTELRLDLVTLAPEGDGRWRVRRLQGIDGW
jgi:putative endonuclease